MYVFCCCFLSGLRFLCFCHFASCVLLSFSPLFFFVCNIHLVSFPQKPSFSLWDHCKGVQKSWISKFQLGINRVMNAAIAVLLHVFFLAMYIPCHSQVVYTTTSGEKHKNNQSSWILFLISVKLFYDILFDYCRVVTSYSLVVWTGTIAQGCDIKIVLFKNEFEA